jgi:hypothetical protein
MQSGYPAGVSAGASPESCCDATAAKATAVDDSSASTAEALMLSSDSFVACSRVVRWTRLVCEEVNCNK